MSVEPSAVDSDHLRTKISKQKNMSNPTHNSSLRFLLP
jgi:hypothetical protein